MNIAFFEIQDWEIPILKKELKTHNLKFFSKPLTPENIPDIKDCQCISIFIYSKINKDILSKLPKLKYLTTRSMGFDHIDLNACKKVGIKVSTAPHYGDNSVAEHTFALLLSLSRNIHKAYLRNLNENHQIEGLKGFDLKGKILCVVGTGRIGRNVIQIASGFQMDVIANDHHPDKAFANKFNFKYVSLPALLKKSDIVTLHVPYCAENHHLINSKTLKMMKSGAVLINTSRGAIVDTDSLLYALNKGKLSGLGIDVIEGEEFIKEEKELLHHPKTLNIKTISQLALDHRIIKNEKVVFTPHIAFYSEEAVRRIIDITIENIISFSKGKSINLVK